MNTEISYPLHVLIFMLVGFFILGLVGGLLIASLL
jgi:hypothetical protein